MQNYGKQIRMSSEVARYMLYHCAPRKYAQHTLTIENLTDDETPCPQQMPGSRQLRTSQKCYAAFELETECSTKS